ncbi:MASE1 domain-containing protein, partial [Klebsiella pneumoniae]|uniref:MASE1 domain-containing protein n=1 Tax=Klebsiella pneumoniae TaxID=573 RepID=UPI0021D331D3
MNLLKYYQQYRDKWWALPLVLPALLLPVARWANTYTMLNGHMVFLYYLPLALVLSLMMFFGWAAIPGIIIGLLLTLAHGMMFEQSIGVLFHFLIPCVLCWGGYRIFVPQRQQVSHGNVRLMPHRLFWQMLLPSVIFLILSQIAEYLGLHPRTTEMTGVTPFSLRSLITFQALMVAPDWRSRRFLSERQLQQWHFRQRRDLPRSGGPCLTASHARPMIAEKVLKEIGDRLK